MGQQSCHPGFQSREQRVARATTICSVGDAVEAVWAGDGRIHGAVIASVSSGGVVTLNWDDGNMTHRHVPLGEIFKSGIPCTIISPSLMPPRERDLHIHNMQRRDLVAKSGRSETLESEQKRMQKLLDGWVSTAPPAVTQHLAVITPVLSWLVVILGFVWPYIVKFVQFVLKVLKFLPVNVLMMLVGLILCFFGGTFPTLIAAAEAARVCGWDRTVAACKDLVNEATLVLEESKKDDLGEGSTLEGKQLIMHKTSLVLMRCHAEKINTAFSGLLQSWIAVEATLRTEYAKTIALALSIGDMVKKPMMFIASPVLVHIVPKGYHQWIPIVIGWIAKSVGMGIAWYVQRLISSVHSGLRGGLLFTQSLLRFVVAHGGHFLPEDPDDTYIDDVLSWPLAAAGFYWQFTQNFNVPFPLNLMTWPFSMLEFMLQWHITRAAQ